jgi:hypothetical protein
MGPWLRQSASRISVEYAATTVSGCRMKATLAWKNAGSTYDASVPPASGGPVARA